MRKEFKIMLTPNDCENETAKRYCSLFENIGREEGFCKVIVRLRRKYNNNKNNYVVMCIYNIYVIILCNRVVIILTY